MKIVHFFTSDLVFAGNLFVLVFCHRWNVVTTFGEKIEGARRQW